MLYLKLTVMLLTLFGTVSLCADTFCLFFLQNRWKAHFVRIFSLLISDDKQTSEKKNHEANIKKKKKNQYFVSLKGLF